MIYRKLILFAVFLAFGVVVLGAYVRLSDAGLGCPDWPGCYGEITPAHAAEEIAAVAATQPHGPVTLPKAWKEMVHRYFASSLGLLIIAIAGIAWRKRLQLKQSPALPIALIGVVVFQGLLGMWTVTRLLKPAIVTAHLLGGLSLLALLTWLALRQLPSSGGAGIMIARSTKRLAALSLAVLGVQIALGGWVSTNYAALACQDFPLCQGSLLPEMDFHNAFHIVRELGMTAQGELLSMQALTAIHWMHRLGALMALAVVGLLAYRLLTGESARPLGKLLAAALLLQILLGIGNIYLGLPLMLAVAHNAGAALLVVVLVVVNFHLWRAAAPEERMVNAQRSGARAQRFAE